MANQLGLIAGTQPVVDAGSATTNFGVAEQIEGVATVGSSTAPITDPMAILMLDRAMARGPHPEYVTFRESTSFQTWSNAFDFIRDAVEGVGGFQNGWYLNAHPREIAKPKASQSDGTVCWTDRQPKFAKRQQLADYDNFARVVCDAYWGYIVQQKDEIRRETTFDPLSEFWEDCDLKGTQIVDFLAQPFRLARMYGTGFVCVDRPGYAVTNQAANMSADMRPYVYSIPTRNVIDWVTDENDRLQAITIAEPYGDEDSYEYSDTATVTTVALRVWTADTWSYWVPEMHEAGLRAEELAKTRYSLREWGVNPIGEVPVVVIHNEMPMPDRFLGRSEMRNVALIARTVYNIDSELREIERNQAFAILAVATKNRQAIEEGVIGTERILGYDPSGPPPMYVAPPLESLVRLQERRDKKVEQAYSMAHLAAVTGFVHTTSGFHTQAEFDKSNRRIGRAAATLEDAEMKIARIVCKWYGQTDDQTRPGGAMDPANPQPLFAVSYPRNFGLRDQEAIIARTLQLLAMGLGHDANLAFVRDLFDVIYPRKPTEEINKLAEAAAAELDKVSVLAMQQAQAANKQAVQQKVRHVLVAAGINQTQSATALG